MPLKPTKTLEILPNPHPDITYQVTLTCPEFTCLCPRTHQPDFATLTIQFVPKEHIVELKSLKAYLWSFRDEKHFHEDVINRIAKYLFEALKPHALCIEGVFNVRGGITTKIRVTLPEEKP